MPPGAKFRGLFINSLLLGTSLLLGLVILEILVRLFFGDELTRPLLPPKEPRPNIYRRNPFPGLRYDYLPGSEKRFCFPDNPRGYFDADNCILYQINARGFRGPEVLKEKPAGVFRVLGLGDSFTLGRGVREEDTYLRQLERLLNRSGQGKFEVLNFGVEGYNTPDEAALLEGRGLEYQPDLVLVGYYLNDAGLALNYWERERFWPGLRRSSRLWELIARRLQWTLLTRSIVRQ